MHRSPPRFTFFPYTTLFRSLHRSDVCLLLCILELRDRDGGKNADDHHHDQKLNERETLAVHLPNLPIEIRNRRRKANGRKTTKASTVPHHRSSPNLMTDQMIRPCTGDR